MSKRKASSVIKQTTGAMAKSTKSARKDATATPPASAQADGVKYWLFKSEPDDFGVDHLKQAPQQTHHWDGVRNYQARNLMRSMNIGDKGFLYHSNAGKATGIAGEIEVVRTAYPDHTALDRKGKYYDARHTEQSPVWFMVDVKLTSAWDKVLTLHQLKAIKDRTGAHESVDRSVSAVLSDMMLLRKGSRLSVQPVTTEEWQCIMGLKNS